MPLMTRVSPTDKIEINGAEISVSRPVKIAIIGEMHIRIERIDGKVFERKPRDTNRGTSSAER